MSKNHGRKNPAGGIVLLGRRRAISEEYRCTSHRTLFHYTFAEKIYEDYLAMVNQWITAMAEETGLEPRLVREFFGGVID